MIAMNLIEVKECMEKLLLKDCFDSFSFIEGNITTFATYTIDGYLKKDFYNSDEQETLQLSDQQYARWGTMRDYCFYLIKGKRTPLNFKFVLSLSTANTTKLLARDLPHIDPSTIQGLYLNFQYANGTLECITGTSTTIFTMDKTLDHYWDEVAMKYLKQKEIAFEKL